MSVTIDNIPFEEINGRIVENLIHEIDMEIKVTFEERKIYMDNNWNRHFQPLLDGYWDWCKKGNCIEGEDWCLGGSWGDCWGNSGTISPDTQPDSCTVFDDFLAEVCPNITFLQYKALYKECVTIEQYSEHDYYGGVSYHARFLFDVKKCYDWLVEKEIIEM